MLVASASRLSKAGSILRPTGSNDELCSDAEWPCKGLNDTYAARFSKFRVKLIRQLGILVQLSTREQCDSRCPCTVQKALHRQARCVGIARCTLRPALACVAFGDWSLVPGHLSSQSACILGFHRYLNESMCIRRLLVIVATCRQDSLCKP